HDGKLPSTSAEKKQFKQLIENGRRNADEENFNEALANAWRAFTPTKVTSQVQEIFNDPECESITANSSSFWIITRAIRDFVTNEGQGLLPLAGAVPDMKADTSTYVTLQTVYATDDF
ncbi:18561_t:CDS:2, partial [Racocetra fulgida]